MSCVHPGEDSFALHRHTEMRADPSSKCANRSPSLALSFVHKDSSKESRASVRDMFLDDEILQGLEVPEALVDEDLVPETFPLTRRTSDGCEANPSENCIAPPTPVGSSRNLLQGSSVEVTCPDLQRMRSWLESQGWTESKSFFSDDYLIKAMSALKDGKPRTFEYAAQKLANALQWRRDYGAASITRSDVARALAPNHMWWDGCDVHGRPVLYVRPALMDLKTYNREEYLKAHVFLIEEGLRRMSPGVDTFVLITDASNLGRKHFDPALMKGLLNVLSVGYPDRLGNIVVGPVNMVVRAAWALLSRVMPKRLAQKIVMAKSPRGTARELLGREPPDWLP